jgi:hypothetical protein
LMTSPRPPLPSSSSGVDASTSNPQASGAYLVWPCERYQRHGNDCHNTPRYTRSRRGANGVSWSDTMNRMQRIITDFAAALAGEWRSALLTGSHTFTWTDNRPSRTAAAASTHREPAPSTGPDVTTALVRVSLRYCTTV